MGNGLLARIVWRLWKGKAMAEYVTKEQVKEEIISWARCVNNPDRLVTEDALYVIDALPAADVRPVRRGRWKWNEDDGHCYCTVCGSVSPESDQNGDECDCPNFCPNCGSYNGDDMRGGDADGGKH